MGCNSESIIFFLWHWSFPTLPWADISVFVWVLNLQLLFFHANSSNCLWTCCHRASLGISPGSCWSCVPSLGPAGLCCPFLALQWPGGGKIFQPLLLHPGSQLLALQASLSQTKPAELPDDIGSFLLSPHKVINERISVVNSLDCFIIYFYFFTIHLSITWNFHWNQQDLQYLFFCLVIQCTVIIQFYCLCLGTSQNECWWNSQLIRDKQSFKKSWTEEELFPTSLTNIN